MPLILTFAALGIAAAALVARPLWALTALVVLMLASALFYALFGIVPHWASGLIHHSAVVWQITLAPIILGVLAGLGLRRRYGPGRAEGE